MKRVDEFIRQRKGNSRVSFSECVVDTWQKIDCGFLGITDEQCKGRGCCWQNSEVDGVPWCYHSNSKTLDQCFMLESERAECGFYGINDDECVKRGCCWLPSNFANTPWCFAPTEPIDNSDNKLCGVPKINPSVRMRIVGGQEAIPHSWPWQVSLRDSYGDHFCGGSIIGKRWIVSAAHCAPALEEGSTIGIAKHFPNDVESYEIVRNIETYFINDDYSREIQYDSDIMLIKLTEDIEYDDNSIPVCLPNPQEKSAEGTECYVTGWGTLSSGGMLATELQQVMVPLLSLETCSQDGWYDRGSLSDNMICAGYEEGGKDSCQGDSGGPLVCHKDGMWTLNGIVSWGYGCAGARLPGLYTKTSNFIDWIEQITAEK